MQEKKRINEILPTVPMRGTVAFPHMVMHFDIAREISKKAVEEALHGDRRLFLTAQRDVFVEDPTDQDLHEIGVVAEIRQTLKTSDDTIRILVEGKYRAMIKSVTRRSGMLMTEVRKIPLNSREVVDEVEMTALLRAIKDLFERYSRLFPRMPKEVMISVMCQDDPMRLYEAIAFNTMFDFRDKQMLLEESSLFARLQLLYEILLKETQVMEIEKEIQERTQESIDQGQREYYLREQLRVISGQLKEETGEGDDDADSYAERICALNLPQESEEKLLKEANRLQHLPMASQEAFVITNYLDTCLELPWHALSEERTDLAAAREQLDADHYGLQKVKERILESLAVRVLNPELKGQILCLVGPPGIGKSSIGRSIAEAVSRKFVRVSLGGVRDEADIRGHRKTYVGAMPGRIIAAMQQAGTNNALLLLDEIDKLGKDYRGDPSSALLEVLDAEQNSTFRDHYLEIPFDLSRVMFITTANTTSTIPAPLLDRMEVIELGSYTDEEKLMIAKNHLLPKQMAKHGIKKSQLRVTDDALREIIACYTRESGVRNLERQLATLCRRCDMRFVSDDAPKRIQVTGAKLEELLGVRRYLPDELPEADTVGLVTGLAWTSVGGETLEVEVNVMDGSGKLEITGNLGTVMKESVQAAVSYIRSRAAKLNIPADFYQKKDIHVHFPEGAIPKDGPSAGITICTAMVSALTDTPVRRDIAMTGEISIRGRVLPIGGLKEKTMAALRHGIKTVIIPQANAKDLEEIDQTVRRALNFITVSHVDTVLSTALVRPVEAEESTAVSVLPEEPALAIPPAPKKKRKTGLRQ